MTRQVRFGRPVGVRRQQPPFNCEQLEPRLALSTVHWDGGGDGVTLTDRYNWECDQVPNGGDHAIIDISGDPLIVHASGNFVVKKLTLAETLTMSGGMTSVSHGTLVRGTFNLEGGAFKGHGDLAIKGKMKWSGGKIWGNGGLETTPEGTLVIAGSGSMDLRRNVENFGATVWLSGDLNGTHGPGTSFVNKPGGLFKIIGAVKYFDLGACDFILNQGTLVRDGEGVAKLLVRFDSSGTVNVVSGTLLIHEGGRNSGERHVAADGVLHYYKNYTHLAGSTLTGGGTTIWQGGKHTIAADMSLGTFMHLTNVTVTGPGVVSVDGPITWNHGTLSGTGGYVINPGGKIALMTPGQHMLEADITNNGTLIWNNGSLHVRDATITNHEEASLFVLSPSTATAEGEARIVNHGEIRKQLPTTLGFGSVTLDNTGLVNVRNGTLALDPAAVVQVQDSTLTAGRWNVFVVGNLDFTGWSLTTVGAAASVTLTRPAARFDALSTLSRLEGTLDVRAGGIFEFASPDFVNTGTLVIHRSTRIRLTGNYVQESTGTLQTGAATPQQFSCGRLVVDGSATLAGQASFTFGLFTPSSGQRYFFFSADSYTGEFEAAAGTPGALEYLPNGVRLQIT